MHKDSTSVPL